MREDRRNSTKGVDMVNQRGRGMKKNYSQILFVYIIEDISMKKGEKSS